MWTVRATEDFTSSAVVSRAEKGPYAPSEQQGGLPRMASGIAEVELASPVLLLRRRVRQCRADRITVLLGIGIVSLSRRELEDKMACSCEGCLAEAAMKPPSTYGYTPSWVTGFPNCCGARVVYGLNGLSTIPAAVSKKVDFATTKPDQTTGIALLKASGFKPVGHFPGQYGAYEVTLWSRGNFRIEGETSEKAKG